MLRSPRLNPKLNFEQAWTKANAEKKALRAPDGRVLKPVITEGIDGDLMDVAYYETGRLASVASFDGFWEVVPAPRMDRPCWCGSNEAFISGDDVYPGYTGWSVCPNCGAV
jgi:hypothetical protein